MNVYVMHVLLIALRLVATSSGLVFEKAKLYSMSESNVSEVTQQSKRFAGYAEICKEDGDCLDPLQVCGSSLFSGIPVMFCRCPTEFPNFFDDGCHRIGECTLDIHCPQNMHHCNVSPNRRVGVCHCRWGNASADGPCPDYPVPSVTPAKHHGEAGASHSNDDVGVGYQHILIIILTVMAAIIVLTLFIACWKTMNRRNSNSSAAAQNTRQGSPSARRFLSTQSSQAVSQPRLHAFETTRPAAFSSQPPNTFLSARSNLRGLQDPPPSYEELFGSSSGAVRPPETHCGTSPAENRN